MYFDTKSYLKNNRNDTIKHTLIVECNLLLTSFVDEDDEVSC